MCAGLFSSIRDRRGARRRRALARRRRAPTESDQSSTDVYGRVGCALVKFLVGSFCHFHNIKPYFFTIFEFSIRIFIHHCCCAQIFQLFHMLVRLFIVTLFLCPIFLNLWPILCRVNFVCFLEFFLDSFARIYFSCPPHLIRCQCCRSIRTHSRLSTRLLLLQCGQLSCRAWDRRVRGKRGGFSPEPAARHSRPSRVPQTIPKTVFPLQIQPESRKQSQI